MKKLLKSKKGVTLIEVIIASGILAIISIATMFFIVPNLKIYTETTNLAELNSIVDNISEEILSSLAQSTSNAQVAPDGSSIIVNIGNTSVTYANGTATNDGVVMKTYGSDGTLRESVPVLPTNYYKNKKINMNAQLFAAGILSVYKIDFTLTNAEGETILQRSVVSRPPIINQYNT